MTIDFGRRKAVMGRSMKLGHCVCNPKNPCPCQVFLDHNVCLCAGEKLPVRTGKAALTQHVRKAGCASKIGQADLLRILGNLPTVADPKVLVGTAAGDDAAIYQLDDRQALVQTVDVFTPCVDDAYLFGQIAAANSASDVYAMGGRPITALSVVGFPIDELDGAIMEEMLRGGIDKLNEAGCALVGGHSINDGEIKCGFAVTGLIDITHTVQRDRAQPGDVLVLTKPLGTGMVSFAAQLGCVSEKVLGEVGAVMATLNKDAAELMVAHGAHACTDITGYGLAGHLVEMTRRSGVNVELDLSRLPVFATVPECLEREVLSGAIERNQSYAMAWVEPGESSEATCLPILYDPQTSGGLLIALPEGAGQAFVDAMHARGHEATSLIGRVGPLEGASEGKVHVQNPTLTNLVGTSEPLAQPSRRIEEEPAPAERAADFSCCDEPPDLACCDSPPVLEERRSDVDPFEPFKAFMKEAGKPGRIDQHNKKLMAIILSIAYHCHPCLKIHLQGAVKMGIPKEDIDEAAALATSFGGCTAMMFYKEVCQELGL